MIIEFENVSRFYKKGKHIIKALDNICFSVEKGEFVVITGKSGSGKSTLINLLAGLDYPDNGFIFFKNLQLSKLNNSELSDYRRRFVGVVFQTFNLINSYTAYQNVSIALAIGGMLRRNRKQVATDLLRKVGLEERLHHLPSELSGGEAQRVAIARAIANKPLVLLADEPTGNLDSQTSIEIMDLMRNLNKNEKVTVILISHDNEIAEKYADRIIKLSDGKVISNIKRTRDECV